MYVCMYVCMCVCVYQGSCRSGLKEEVVWGAYYVLRGHLPHSLSAAVAALLWTFFHIGLMICALDALRRRSLGRAVFVVGMHFFISLVVGGVAWAGTGFA